MRHRPITGELLVANFSQFSSRKMSIYRPVCDCPGGVTVRASDFRSAVVGSIPGRGVIYAPRSTQPSIPPRWVNRVPALLAGVKARCALLCRAAGKIV